jgi:hypothetical protein
MVEVLDFLMGYANDEYRSRVGATNRPENIVIGYVSFVSLTSLGVDSVLPSRVIPSLK